MKLLSNSNATHFSDTAHYFPKHKCVQRKLDLIFPDLLAQNEHSAWAFGRSIAMLNKLLHNKAVLHKEEPGHESEIFKSYFPAEIPL